MLHEIRLRRSFSLAGPVLVAISFVLHAQEIPSGPPVPPRPGVVLVDDMWLPAAVVSGDSTFTATPWPSGNVRIAFDPAISSAHRDLFRRYWTEIECTANIDFFEVTPSYSGDFILVVPNTGYPSVSHSEIGMQGGQQILAVGANHWDSKFVLVHELFHALGYLHEQSRPDRNSFVTINYNNISQTACNGSSCDHNFDLVGGAFTSGAYDFESIMHYNDTAFGINGAVTIQAKPAYAAFQDSMGNRAHMTNGDANGLQARYGQPSTPTITYVVPNAVEAGTVGQLTITVGGSWYHEGSLDGGGILGTRVRFNGVPVNTTVIDRYTATAVVPGNLLQNAGNVAVDILNDNNAGGPSSTSVNFIILPPPCTSQFDRVGQSVTWIGDVNGDAKDDYVVGSSGVSTAGGRVRCYSGATGAALWTLNGPTNSELGFAVASMGDVTGDGKSEVLVGAPGYNSDAGRVQMLNGATGAILATINYGTAGARFGTSVAGIGDVDGDGDLDFLVGAPSYNSSAGRAEVWSSNGGLMRAHNGGAASDSFGWSVGGGVDVTGDGVPDYIVGAPKRASGTGAFEAGRAYVFSGATGSNVVNKDGDGAYDNFGFSVALVPETASSGPSGAIVVGAPEIPNFFSGTGNGTGYVRVFGHSSLLLSYATRFTWTGAAVGDRFGLSVGSAGDVNDDGSNDILIGIPQMTFPFAATGPGTFEIRSGKTGAVLYHHNSGANDEQLGWSVAGDGDADGDARIDVLVGAPGSDVGCVDAGLYYVVFPPVPPEPQKVMITEVTTGNPDAVELTNFSTTTVSLTNWSVVWKDGSTLTSSPLNVTIAPGEIIVVKEASGTLPEVPANTQVLALLPAIGTITGDLAVALVNNNKIVVDEVHIQGATGTYAEGSLGGKFRGIVYSELTNPSELNAERIWGLDSNSGGDWTTGRPRSFGLENVASGLRGQDPIAIRSVRINEVDDSPDYVELHRPGTLLLSPSVNVQGWYLLTSPAQNSAHTRIDPFPTPRTMAANSYVVLGETTSPPAEMATTSNYVNVVPLGYNLPFVGEEFSCALYDSYGRCVDVLRTTGATHVIPHNAPRAPSAWTEFTGAAFRSTISSGAIGRTPTGFDSNTGKDFRTQPTRSMGSANLATFPTGGDVDLDARLHETGVPGGMTIILNAGSDHAGEKWTYAFSLGHQLGTGPVLGLGADAVNNWLFTISTPGLYGVLDSMGSARLDFPPGTLPPGIQTDGIFFLQPNTGNLFEPFITQTRILEFDT